MAPKKLIKQEPLDNDNTLPPLSRRRRRSKSFPRWLTSHVLRLAVWYSLFQFIFRCPSDISQLTSDHSRVCRPYLNTKTYLAPHLGPYYDTYAAPLLQTAKPYTDVAYNNALLPAWSFSKANYNRFGAPRVARGQAVAQDQWKKLVKPRIDSARVQAQAQYDASLGPHVKQAYDAVYPHYEASRKVVADQYEKNVVPTYEKSLPYAQAAAGRVQKFANEVGYPYARWAADNASRFFMRRIWPQLRILYGENVHPQLVKIRERLANYREGKKLEAMMDAEPTPDTFSQSAAIAAESLSSAVAEGINSLTASATTIASSSSSAGDSAAATDSAEAVKEKVAEELKKWQVKFVKAADKAAEDLDDRINEIVTRQIKDDIRGTGDALLVRLKETARTAVNGLRSRIIHTIENLPEEPTEEEEDKALEKVRADIRTAGQTVKGAAQDVRSWKAKSNADTADLIKQASDSTVEVLDSIRDLGLQEIGMRWASMEGVTFDDWSEYHTLKKTFAKWRGKVAEVSSKNKGAARARKVSDDIEDQAMAIAEDIAMELIRMRDVSTWKIQLQDATDDWSDRILPARAAKAKQQIIDAVSEALASSQTPPSEGVESVTSKISEAVIDNAEAATSKIAQAAGEAAASAKSVAEPVVDYIADLPSQASEAIIDPIESLVETVTSTQTVVEGLRTLTSSLAEVPSSLSESIISKVSVQEAVSSASSSLSSAASAAGSVVGSVSSDASSSASSGYSSVSKAASSVLDEVQDGASSIRSRVAGSSASGPAAQVSSASKAASSVAADVQDAAASVKAKVVGSSSGPADTLSSVVEKSVVSPAKSVASSASSSASSVASSVNSVASSAASSVSSSASSLGSQASKSASSSVQSVVSDASKGAETVSRSVRSAASKASGSASSVIRAASEKVVHAEL